MRERERVSVTAIIVMFFHQDDKIFLARDTETPRLPVPSPITGTSIRLIDTWESIGPWPSSPSGSFPARFPRGLCLARGLPLPYKVSVLSASNVGLGLMDYGRHDAYTRWPLSRRIAEDVYRFLYDCHRYVG